jgi:hypothetical protein
MKTKQDVYASVSYRDVWMALEPAASPPDMRTVQYKGQGPPAIGHPTRYNQRCPQHDIPPRLHGMRV